MVIPFSFVDCNSALPTWLYCPTTSSQSWWNYHWYRVSWNFLFFKIVFNCFFFLSQHWLCYISSLYKFSLCKLYSEYSDLFSVLYQKKKKKKTVIYFQKHLKCLTRESWPFLQWRLDNIWHTFGLAWSSTLGNSRGRTSILGRWIWWVCCF